MKKLYLIAFSIAVSSLSLFLFNGNADIDNSRNGDLHKIVDKYGESAYRSFYSLEELRPFSIIQLDKTLELYTKDWISPGKYVSILDNSDKKLLRDKITGFLKEKDIEQRTEILNKIKYWCTAEKQFAVIRESMCIYDDAILKAVDNIELTSNLFDDGSFLKNEGDMSGLTSIDKDKIFSKTYNRLAGLEFRSQLYYYSRLFDELNNLASN